MELTRETLLIKIKDEQDYHYKLEKQLSEYDKIIKFLMERDNKLQQIETMFKNEVVDLEKLSKLVKEVD